MPAWYRWAKKVLKRAAFGNAIAIHERCCCPGGCCCPPCDQPNADPPIPLKGRLTADENQCPLLADTPDWEWAEVQPDQDECRRYAGSPALTPGSLPCAPGLQLYLTWKPGCSTPELLYEWNVGDPNNEHIGEVPPDSGQCNPFAFTFTIPKRQPQDDASLPNDPDHCCTEPIEIRVWCPGCCCDRFLTEVPYTICFRITATQEDGGTQVVEDIELSSTILRPCEFTEPNWPPGNGVCDLYDELIELCCCPCTVLPNPEPDCSPFEVESYRLTLLSNGTCDDIRDYGPPDAGATCDPFNVVFSDIPVSCEPEEGGECVSVTVEFYECGGAATAPRRSQASREAQRRYRARQIGERLAEEAEAEIPEEVKKWLDSLAIS